MISLIWLKLLWTWILLTVGMSYGANEPKCNELHLPVAEGLVEADSFIRSSIDFDL